MNREDKKQYKAFLDDICGEYCAPHHYCILKEFLISSHPSPRMLMQFECINKRKYEWGKQYDREITWQEAMELWVKEGHAKKFGDVYNEDMPFKALYKKIMNGNGDKK
jgi:hypothetical protein